MSSPWNLATYLSPRFTSDSLRGLKRHITLMLHSAGSAIFLAARAAGREPLPAAQSRVSGGSRGTGVARAGRAGLRSAARPGQRRAARPKRSRRQPAPEAHFRSIMAALGGGARSLGAPRSPSAASAGCRTGEQRRPPFLGGAAGPSARPTSRSRRLAGFRAADARTLQRPQTPGRLQAGRAGGALRRRRVRPGNQS